VLEPILQARTGEWLDRQAGGEILVAVADLDGVAVGRIAISVGKENDRARALDERRGYRCYGARPQLDR